MPIRSVAALLALAVLAALPPGTVRAEAERWTVDSGTSRVGFDAFHAWGNFSGASESPSGEIELDVTDLKKPVTGGLTVLAASFRTGKASRDKDLRRNLESERHPQINYRIDKVESSFASVAENSDVLLTIHGVLTMRGTGRPVTFMGRVRLKDGGLWARGESRLRPADFGVAPLRSWLVAMKEYVLVTFDLRLSKSK